MDVSIIIVNFNTKELLSNCINSIYKNTKDITFEIIVSDNGSTDGSIEMLKSTFPNVILLENNQNLGFGTANNKALKKANGKYILYLNSDTIILNNAIKLFYDYWENNSNKDTIGALGCNLIDENYKITHSYGKFPTIKRILKEATLDVLYILKLSFFFFLPDSFSFFKSKKNHKQNQNIPVNNMEVEYIIGADLFLKNDLNAYFDEKFFLYFEDADLQTYFQKENLKRIIIETPLIQHLEHKSEKKQTSKIDYFRKQGKLNSTISAIIYAKKHFYKPIYIFYLKVLALIYFFNPLIFSNSKKFIKKMLSI